MGRVWWREVTELLMKAMHSTPTAVKRKMVATARHSSVRLEVLAATKTRLVS